MKIKGLLLVALCCVCSVFNVFGQGWENVYSTDYYSVGKDIIGLEAGGYIALSTSKDSSLNNQIELTKIDEAGGLVWQKMPIAEDLGSEIAETILEGTDDDFFVLSSKSEIVDQDIISYIRLYRFNALGDTIWSMSYIHDNIPTLPEDLIHTPEGNVLIVGKYIDYDAGQNGAILMKVDVDGNIVWQKIYELNASNFSYLTNITSLSSGGYIGVGPWDDSEEVNIIRFDEQGEVIWQQAYLQAEVDYFTDIKEAPNGDLLVSGAISDLDGFFSFLMRIDLDGNELWSHFYPYNYFIVTSLVPAHNEGYVLTGSYLGNVTNPGVILKANEQGEEEWLRLIDDTYAGGDAVMLEIKKASGEDYIAIGHANSNTYIIKVDSLGNSYTSNINGWVYSDSNNDCIAGVDENGLSNWIVQIEKDGQTSYTITDSSGAFNIVVDTGFYTLSIVPSNDYWASCESFYDISIPSFYDTVQIDMGAKAILNCPALSVDVSVPFLRRCFDNTYTVQYHNYGTLPAEGASIEIILDPYFYMVSSNITYIELANNTFQFDLGDILVNEEGSFQFVAYLDCDSTALGQTHCVEAHIFPDSLCGVSNIPEAIINLSSKCEGDSIVFILKNVGDGDMNAPAEYIVIEDDVMYAPMPYQLDAGDSLRVPIASNGSTFRMESLRYPDNSNEVIVSQTVEGCSDDDFTVGFVNQFSLYPNSDFEDIDCQENIGSYDPNDKRGFPYGYGESHFISPGTSLDYHIRFQNTGTDTAFTVVIKDTLSSLLNPATVRIGAASHDYSWDLTGEGILTFTFNNIMLPDSNVNEAASHGFVSFHVEPIIPQQLGDVIENNAAIYFDFNEPIITNTTFHTVNEGFVEIINTSNTVEHAVQIEIKAYPNPTVREQVTLEVDALKIAEGTFYLYTTQGQLIHTQRFDNPTFTIDLVDFSSGLYFFNLELEHGKHGTGKLIINK